MKKAKRALGWFLIFSGVIFAIGGLSAIFNSLFQDMPLGNKLTLLISMLVMLLIGAGIARLGFRLLQGPAGSDAFPRPAPAPKSEPKPAPAPKPTPVPPSPKQHEWAENYRREQQELLRKREQAHRDWLATWQHINPSDILDEAGWETALAGPCKMTRYHLVGGKGDSGLDGCYDHTETDWFCLDRDSDLAATIALYAQINTYRHACRARGQFRVFPHSHTLSILVKPYYRCRFLILSSQAQFDSPGPRQEECLALCRKHDLSLVRGLLNDRYYDYVTGNTYEVYVAAEFPGSADDAAAYGSLGLRILPPE